MRTGLLLVLFALATCSFGGWQKESLYSNNAIIDRAFRFAIADFLKTNGITVDDVELLSIYSQLVAGTNYKFTYVNRNAPLKGIQETVVNVPLANSNGMMKVISDELKKEHYLLSLNDPRFSKVHQVVYNGFKNSETQKVLHIKKVSFVSTESATYFICTAQTPRGDGYYAVSYDKETSEYNLINKL